MQKPISSAVLVVSLLSTSVAAPPSKKEGKPRGILIFDNCDDRYKGKETYGDNLTLIDSSGRQTFRMSGFNNCESIGSSRMVAADSARKSIWVLENVARRIRRFNLAGKLTLTIDGVHGSAIAVDSVSGNLWVLASEGAIGKGKTLVYDGRGKLIASHAVTGWDIAYDPNAKAFWIAGRKLTKISAKGKVLFSKKIAQWCASSVAVDPGRDTAWVAVRRHSEVVGSRNRLLKFDGDGENVEAIELGKKIPFRVSVDPTDASVWVANLRSSVQRFSADGKSQGEFPVKALSVQVDPAGGDAWVVTPTEVQKMSRRGKVTHRVPHAGPTSQAWMAPLK